MSTLDLPSKKLFIQEVKEHYIKTKPSQHPVSVWVQGTVIENNDNCSQQVIDDGTGIIQVLGNDKIPNCPKVKKDTGIHKLQGSQTDRQYAMITGIVIFCRRDRETDRQYVMITGIVLDVETTPILRAIKVQDLSANSIMETMWILEVIDQTLTCSS
ncbi:hypothetical protein LOTGIDRAFT_152556 [Lottia gigantea]|uniref:OB domain-containing protein n=1 Tax=Lottia gigantea TaxID=225164 RepID=V4ANE1_LOTGI|nr:hypothetical protein LOTGIDRAFT_152556 [Lottia gigantea]ESP05689.1 hypothetical protein LOTGIDRAFT_152556 [Lottia gigantea]